jgi:competence protein ComEC
MSPSRVFLSALVMVLAGVAARSFVVMPVILLFAAAMAGIAWAGAGIIARRRGMWIAGLWCIAFVGGALRFATGEAGQPDMTPLYGVQATFRGVIDEEPERVPPNQRIAVAVSLLNGRRPRRSIRMLATLRQFPEYAIGDEVILRGAVDAPRLSRDGAFDYGSYLKRRGIAATLFYPAVERIGRGEGGWLALRLTAVKHAFENDIDAILPEPHAGFLKGLILGARASLPQALVVDFQRTGTSHMIALSGYNITIIGSAIQRVFLILTLPFGLSFWLASGAIILFILMTGASASVVRAGIMGLLLLIAQREGRAYRMTPALAFAAAVMVLHNPYILRFDAGFQLSFGATLGLVYLSPAVDRWIDAVWRALRRDTTARGVVASDGGHARVSPVRRILTETIAAQIAVMPLLIVLFGRISVISPVVNLLVLLATPYAMGIGFAAAAVDAVSHVLGRTGGAFAWVILEYQLRVIGWFARFPYAAFEPGLPAYAGIALFYVWMTYYVWKISKNTARSGR